MKNLILFVILSIPFLANATSFSGTLDSRIDRIYSTYTQEEGGNKETEVVLKVVETDAQGVNVTTINGQKETEVINKSESPDTTIGEYQRLIIKKGAKNLVNIVEYGLKIENANGLTIKLPYRMEYEAELTSGAWDDVIANKDVTIAATAKGKKQFYDQFKKLMERDAKDVMLAAFQSQYPEHKISLSVSVKSLEVSSDGLKGNLYQFTSVGSAKTKISFRGSIRE